MSLFDRIIRVTKANLNDMISEAEDPEKVLEKSIIKMQENLVQFRQAAAQAIVTQKRTQQQYDIAQTEANNWHQRAQIALQKGDKNLAIEALIRKKTYTDRANKLKPQIDLETAHVDILKRNLIALESKVAEAKLKKDKFKGQIAARKAQEQLQRTVGRMGTSTAMAAFDRLEEKVLQMEARAQFPGELAGNDLEIYVSIHESGSDVDDELMAMKAQLTGAFPNQVTLPPSNQSNVLPSNSSSTRSSVDKDLEELRRQMDQL
ncbi:PspA/IM30 family protein [Microseira sp. BLCC-F43]|jgi:phage shock protein A|uniref:PspA/IM30 family protein n=1 Tax=Microseira sp. BLCC-F43 TaxID=3153602 RepID=UPI0035B8E1F0